MSIKYNEYRNSGEEVEQDISYWITNNVENITGIENRQTALIGLVSLLCERIAEPSQDLGLLQAIAYEIQCPHYKHRFNKNNES